MKSAESDTLCSLLERFNRDLGSLRSSPLLLTGVFLSVIVKSLRVNQHNDFAIVYNERVVCPEATELEKGLQRIKTNIRIVNYYQTRPSVLSPRSFNLPAFYLVNFVHFYCFHFVL